VAFHLYSLGDTKMNDELLKIFDENYNQIGVTTREEAHLKGYWHEAFHCWFITKEEGKHYLYLQLRSDKKRDYPSLLDITAAGHLQAHETIQDGVREIKEEIGIEVAFQELIPLGIMKYSVTKDNFIDNELANVYLFKSHHRLRDFTLQIEEVAGIVKVEFSEFYELWFGKREDVFIQGFCIKGSEKIIISEHVGRKKFVPHHIKFYQNVITQIRENL
jgi:isopentenyldiphosphate isomerase